MWPSLKQRKETLEASDVMGVDIASADINLYRTQMTQKTQIFAKNTKKRRKFVSFVLVAF
jgi:hypothetical protein